MNKPKVKVPKGWRKLRANEIITRKDRYWNGIMDDFFDVFRSAGKRPSDRLQEFYIRRKAASRRGK